MTCADCGLVFEKREGPATAKESAGRMDTPAGPMHFACYQQFRERAVQQAYAVLLMHKEAVQGAYPDKRP